MISHPKILWFGFGAVALTVVGYNLWSYSCGRCTLHMLMTIGPPAYALFALNLLLAVIYLLLKRNHDNRLKENQCHCGEMLSMEWKYCQKCGSVCSARA